MIKAFSAIMHYDETSLAQKAYYQFEYLGYVDIVEPNATGYAVAISVNAKYSPRVRMYGLKHGNIIDVKIPKPQFRKNPIEEGDVIVALSQKKKQKVHMTDSGEFKPVEGEFDWWIQDYDIIKVTKDK